MNNWLTFDMIRVWPIKSNKCKLHLVLVLILILLLLILLFFSLQDFCNLLDFRFNVKIFLYFSQDIANFRFLLHNCLFSCWLENSSFLASSILLTWLSISESFKKLIFHAERSRGCIWYTTPRRCAYLAIFRFLVEKLKWTTSQLKKILKWSQT